MRIFFIGLILLVFFGCEKRTNEPTMISKASKNLPEMKFDKDIDVTINHTNTEKINVLTRRDKDKLVLFASSLVDTLKPPYLITVITENRFVFSAFSDDEGMLAGKIPPEYSNDTLIIDIQKNSSHIMQVLAPREDFCYYTFPDSALIIEKIPNTLFYCTPNKPIYSPGETVYITSVAKGFSYSKISSDTIARVEVIIGNDLSSPIYRNTHHKVHKNILIDSFTIPANTPSDLYKVFVHTDREDSWSRRIISQFHVQSLCKPSITVSLDTLPKITIGDTLNLRITGHTPKEINFEKRTVKVTAYRQNRIQHPKNNTRGYYNRINNSSYREPFFVKEVPFNTRGTINQTIPLNKLSELENYEFIEVEVLYRDANGRQAIAYGSTRRAFPESPFQIQTEFTENKPNQETRIFISAIHNDKPLVNKQLQLSITGRFPDTTIYTDSFGAAAISYTFEKPDIYTLKVQCDSLKTQEEIVIRDYPMKEPAIRFDKAHYNFGDTARITLLNKKHKHFHYTLESNSIQDWGIIRLKSPPQPIKLPINQRSGTIQKVFIENIGVFTLPISTKTIIANVTKRQILHKKRFNLSVTLKDHEQKPIKGNFSLTLINQKCLPYSNYLTQFKHYSLKPICNFDGGLRVDTLTQKWSDNISILFPDQLNSLTTGKKVVKAKKRPRRSSKKRTLKRTKSSYDNAAKGRRLAPRYSIYVYSPTYSLFPFPENNESLDNSPLAYSLTEEENYSYFIPNIATDENGEAEISIPLPNVEGEWILRAIGSDGEGHLIDFTDTIVTKGAM